MNVSRETIVKTAIKYNGVKGGSSSHLKILENYNNISPLPRGVKMTKSMSWFAAFASAIFAEAGATAADFPFECSCSEMMNKAMKMGVWQENDTYVPSPGDLILYDWNDTGAGDNTGAPDHVGIVVDVSHETILVVEGNKNNAVGERNIKVNGKFIRGFICPKFPASVADPADAWASDAWARAEAAGVMDGTRPRDSLTRQQLAVILQRLKLI